MLARARFDSWAIFRKRNVVFEMWAGPLGGHLSVKHPNPAEFNGHKTLKLTIMRKNM